MRPGRAILVAVLTSVQLACSGSAPTGTGPGIAGAWELASVNGVNLPVVLSVNGADTTFLETELLILPPAGRYSRSGVKVTGRLSTFESRVTSTVSGTYARQGSSYSFKDDSLGVGSGSVTNGMLTIAFGEQVRLFSPVE